MNYENSKLWIMQEWQYRNNWLKQKYVIHKKLDSLVKWGAFGPIIQC